MSICSQHREPDLNCPRCEANIRSLLDAYERVIASRSAPLPAAVDDGRVEEEFNPALTEAVLEAIEVQMDDPWVTAIIAELRHMRTLYCDMTVEAWSSPGWGWWRLVSTHER